MVGGMLMLKERLMLDGVLMAKGELSLKRPLLMQKHGHQ